MTHPAVQGHGGVVRLPKAAYQPQADARIVVDVTHGGDPQQLNSAIEKLARYVNIYAGAGAQPAKPRITVVLHGKATLVALNARAYGRRFEVEGNPNLKLMGELRKAGVEFLVCGQSLISKKGTPEQVAEGVEVAVSALTALVNLQSSGYAYVPLP